MKKVLSAAFVLIALFAATPPAEAARVYVGVGVGGGPCCGYYPPGWGYGYPGYYSPYYVAPPPVVYVPPPAYYPAPAPAPAAYAAPAPAGMPADQASPTYTDQQGQTCREYQSTAVVAGATQPTYGTACLQPDGSWRVVK